MASLPDKPRRDSSDSADFAEGPLRNDLDKPQAATAVPSSSVNWTAPISARMAATKLKCKSDARVQVNDPIETIELPDRKYIADSRFNNPPSDRMKNVTAPATRNPRLAVLRRERPRINGQAEPSKTASGFS